MCNNKKCKTCVYRSPLLNGGSFGGVFCEYILYTGHRRGCPGGDECTRYKYGPRIGEAFQIDYYSINKSNISFEKTRNTVNNRKQFEKEIKNK